MPLFLLGCDPALVLNPLRLRLSLLAAAIVAAAISGSSTAHADDRAPWPGLPFLTYDTSRLADGGAGGTGRFPEAGWLGTGQVARAGSVKGKQWASLPLTMVAVNAVWTNESTPRPVPPDKPALIDTINAYVFMVSPDDSVGGHNYGDSALVPVRTVAFGSIPVEATLQVSQLRDADGTPEELELELAQRAWGTGRNRYYTFDEVNLRASVIVRLRQLKLDGVDVRLQDSCRTHTPALLDVAAQPWATEPGGGTLAGQYDPEVGMLGQSGAHFDGTIDIPAFSGCITNSGDNLSGIVSTVLAGEDNPVSVRVGAQGCFHLPKSGDPYNLPPGPGETTPEEAECVMGALYPENPALKTIPDPLPFPDHAPGDQP